MTGDDKATASALKKANRKEREGQRGLFTAAPEMPEAVADEFQILGALDERTPADVRAKEELYARLRGDGSVWWALKTACDLWTAAFFMPLRPTQGWDQSLVPTTDTVRGYLAQPQAALGPLVGAAVALSQEHPFFHWPLEFPDVFEQGGFDVVLGNPPWEQVQLDPREFFGTSAPDITDAAHMAARDKAIEHLAVSNPSLYLAYMEETRKMENVQTFVHGSGRFPLTSFGRLNTAPLFAELSRVLQRRSGRAGLILPTGIATDSFNQYFFASLVDDLALVSLYDFENREEIFPGVHRSYKFCLLTITATPTLNSAYAFFCTRTEQLQEPERLFQLTREDIALLNPNTKTCPIFRSRKDADLTKAIYRRVPVFVSEANGVEGNPWGFHGLLMFMMNTASGLFRTQKQLQSEGWQLTGNIFHKDKDAYLPLYEGKMLHQYDHRWATYDGGETRDLTLAEKIDLSYTITPRYWVPQQEMESRLADRWARNWLVGWRDITNATNERTAIFSLIPRVGVGHTAPLLMVADSDPFSVACLLSNMNSLALDYVVRQKVGGTHLTYGFLKQLPILPPSAFTPRDVDHIAPRVLELLYTSWGLRPFAQDMGFDGDPFQWDDGRRFRLRCDLDAYFFHLYDIGRADVDYIMDTFPIVKRKDEARYGEYRTKRVILEVYDALATEMDPPLRRVAEGRVAYGAS